MNVVKQENEFGTQIFFQDYRKYIGFTFGGNGDLYLSIHSEFDSNRHEFVITKENYYAYKLFEQLFSDIENINIFDDIEDNAFIITNEEKENYRLYNKARYNELFDKNNNTITWFSDETAHDVANYLKIKKEKDLFKLEFNIQPYVEGYFRDFNSPKYIPIRFRNSGSRYDPFNIVFMRLYHNLKAIDDINDYGHQIHIEEYLYKVKKLTK